MKTKIEALEKRYFTKKLTDKEKALTEVFFIFAFYDEDLPEKLVNYVLHGDAIDAMENLKFLQSIQAIPFENFFVTFTTINLHGFQPSTDKQKKEKALIRDQLQRSLTSLEKIYSAWNDGLTHKEWIRLGKALSYMPDSHMSQNNTQTAIPLWLLTLIQYDGFTYSTEPYSCYTFKEPSLTLKKLMAVLEDDGLESHIVFDLLCDIHLADHPAYFDWRLNEILKFDDLKETLLQNIEAMIDRFNQFNDTKVRLAQLDLLKKLPYLVEYMADFLIDLALSSSKTIAKEAFPFLSQLDNDQVVSQLNHYLCEGSSTERGKSAELLAFFEETEPLLQSAFEKEKVASVKTKIQTSLSNLHRAKRSEEKDVFVIPPFTPKEIQKLPKGEALAVLKENLKDLLEKFRLASEIEHANNIARKNEKDFRPMGRQAHFYSVYQTITDKDLMVMLDYINGENIDTTDENTTFPKFATLFFRLSQELGFYKNRMFNVEGYSLYHAFRTIKLGLLTERYIYDFFKYPELYLKTDLRQIYYELEQSGCSYHAKRQIAVEYLYRYSWSNIAPVITGELAWPFFAEHIELIEEGLGLVPSTKAQYESGFDVNATLCVIDYFPVIPPQILPHLLELALGEGKSLRPIAQKILSKITDIYLRAEEALNSTKQEIRRTAIEWLAELKQLSSLRALYALLQKEKNEMVRATLLTALESFGEDIASYLSPKVLLQEAEKGLASKIPASFARFDRHQLPTCHWQDGKKADDDIIYYWVVLAVKLKMSEGNGLFQRYLSLLDKKSQQALGQVLLQAFIQQDIITITEDEALTIAKREAPARLAQHQKWAENDADWADPYRGATLESVIKEIKREELAKYLGSVIKDKGMLAFIHGIEAQVAVTIVTRFMRDHYKRRAQIEAILLALAISEDPLIIQLILSVSRRHRTASVQALAKTLVEEIGGRNGWSKDELADRTIPTAGIEDSGCLELDYGARMFIAKLNDQRTLTLFSPEGKEIKALPAPRKDEDEELAKESKKQFANSKKELKQIIDLQVERLFEAMCAKRLWSVHDWQTYFASHPIMKHLIQQLVWLNVKEDESMIHSFRPTEDGSLITVEDDEITLEDNSYVMLAHSALLDAPLNKAWQTHLKDYKVTPLFAQFENEIPEIEKLENNEILDREGWITDTFTFRNNMNKLGYKRGDVEDGGFFDYYSKYFESMNCYIIIRFSGNAVPEENMTAILLGLSFQNSRSWNAKSLDLQEIPPILLAEGYGDYLNVAKACSGFDPEWERKNPW